MQASQQSLFTRDDTFFGVCEALGEDFGFNPLYLRVAIGVAILWNPAVVIGAYVAAGVLVALSRWIFPGRRHERTEWKPVAQRRSAAEAASPTAGNDDPLVADAIAA